MYLSATGAGRTIVAIPSWPETVLGSVENEKAAKISAKPTIKVFFTMKLLRNNMDVELNCWEIDWIVGEKNGDFVVTANTVIKQLTTLF